MRFKVGDIITGTRESVREYRVTTDEAIMRITSLDYDWMDVNMIKHDTYPEEIGCSFIVNQRYFRKVCNEVL